MAKKLGQILVERKIITQGQLKKALDAQLIFGGKIGTNLIELGFVDEGTLSAALQSQKQADVAAPQDFERIPPNALRMIPARVAERHKVVPLALQDRKLRVAMADPSDLLVLDELQFITGCTIEPTIAPEARILSALEKYYEVPRPMRYVTLPLEIRRQIARDREDDAPDSPAPEPAPPPPPPPPVILEAVPTAPAEDPALRRQREREEARRREEEERLPLPDSDEVARRLASVETRDEIGEILLRHLRTVFPRSALFILQRDQTLGWNAIGEGISPSRVRQVLIPADLPSIFDSFRRGTPYYLGTLEDLPGNTLLVSSLGDLRPAGVFLLPIEMQERRIAIVYGDNGHEPLGRVDLRALRALVSRAGLALEMLLLKHRILQ